MNPTTRKHPRSLNEAFGPYCTPFIDRPPLWRRALYAFVSVTICGCTVLFFLLAVTGNPL